ncbi:MAG: Lsm family RNA-binding protein [Promethearchaeati archaeon SRVP18_Atabeyarchaeia-1]
MPEDLAGRNFFKELASLVGSVVAVTTTEGKTYTGELKGYDPSSLSVCLASAKDGEGRSFHRLVLNGSIVRHIAKTEEPFDLKTLANEIQRIFPPGEVKYIEEARVIQVLDKIKVTESGVEGSGPLTERVKTIYEKFVEQRGKK